MTIKKIPTGGIESSAITSDLVSNNTVTHAKYQQVATDTIIGRSDAGTGNVKELTGAEVRGIINVADGANAYVHPNHTGDVTSTGDGATVISNNAVTNDKILNATIDAETKIAAGSIVNSLIADGTIEQVKLAGNFANGTLADGSVTTAKLADNAVTHAKYQQVATDTIIGRTAAGTGNVTALTATEVRGIINVADGANNYSHPNHSGDVTSNGDGATTIANNAVTHAKYQQVATDTIIGRTAAGTGNVTALTAAEVRGIINVADGANNYSHPNHTGDVTSTGDGATVIANGAVTAAKCSSDIVVTSGNQTIGGDKTFSNPINADSLLGTSTASGDMVIQAVATNADLSLSGSSNTSTRIVFSDNVRPDTNNSKELGQGGGSPIAFNTIHTYALNNLSDQRLKTNIQDSDLGLNFIKALRPVSYRWIIGENKFSYDENGDQVITETPGVRPHYGFLAQQVKESIDQCGVDDFGGWVLGDVEDPDSTQQLRYNEFISPLVKAVQEQQAIIEALQARIEALENA